MTSATCICLIISCCPLFLIGAVMKNCSTSCKMEHRHTLRFLFLRGLTAIFVVGELGVEDHQHDVRGISFSKLSTLDELQQQYRDMVVLTF